jgi:hypothetical protein
MILSLRTTRKHVAAARSDGNLAAPVTCAIVRPTKPGVPDLPLSLNRSMLPARKQNGAVAPWNHYSRVPLFPRWQEAAMNGIIYLIGLIVVILAILSFFGLR